ncbi:glycoside hydrolase family 127 protein [Symbioplanes lichenis]|uniref:glycoside hydrolase family 127 protein n=1 Tax=Symbioplanes lichenis TaxID=1629072 RepID=UPI0027385F40|nr:beta-L-arabinofuranosidase domain-containing protein [Actinoplanes lichenis]
MTDIQGPVVPTPESVSVFRPLPANAVRLGAAGLLGGWQARNAAATLPHCVTQLDAYGNLANLRRITGDAEGDFRGMWFADTDVHKTLEAAFWEHGRAGAGDASSPALPEFVAEVAELLEKAQDPDGYLNSYYQGDHRDEQWAELHFSHEMYTAGHLIQAAVAAVRSAPGDPPAEQVMTVARRFADLLVQRFGQSPEVDGHPEIETALAELYRVTGHRPYLDLAARLLDNRGRGVLGEGRFGPRYFQDHEPLRGATEVTGHVVRQLYLLAGAVDVAVETHDDELLAAAERLWESALASRTYVTGGQGSRHRDEAFGDPYELPPDRAYAETCAAIGGFQLAWRLLLATGDSKYADELERLLYNGIAASTAVDGIGFFYSNPLQLRAGHDGSHEDAPTQRLPWYSCACCPPNLARLMASLHSYVATGDADEVQLHLYAPGTIHAAGRTLRIDTAYPWDARVTITVTETTAEPWELSVRIPAWCTTADVDGEPVAPGRLRLRRTWRAGDQVVLTLPMPPRLVTAHPRVDAVRGAAALARGPVVYCLEQAGLDDDLEDLELDPAAPPRITDGHGLLVSARVRPPEHQLYRTPAAPPAVPEKSVTVTAIPYFLWANRAPGPMRVWIPLAAREE